MANANEFVWLFFSSARIACLIHYSHIDVCVCVCSYVENVGGKRTHNHQCNEDTTISRWRWRILLAVCKENWKEKERGRDKYICTL
jgi:hypothetical protein